MSRHCFSQVNVPLDVLADFFFLKPLLNGADLKVLFHHLGPRPAASWLAENLHKQLRDSWAKWWAGHC